MDEFSGSARKFYQPTSIVAYLVPHCRSVPQLHDCLDTPIVEENVDGPHHLSPLQVTDSQ